jgi:3-methylfumaryl-CoA hydratase
MYAGTRITFHAPILVGDRLRREIELTDLQVPRGRHRHPRHHHADAAHLDAARPRRHRGVRHGVPRGGEAGRQERHPQRDEVPADLPWRRTVTPDPVALFRFSAITFNPHRIHYDRAYAMEVEGLSGPRRAWPFTQAC